MIITEELRAKLLPHLPDDYQKQGSEATGFSRSMIYKVLHEEQENEKIYDWLIHTALKTKRMKELKEKKRMKITEQL